MTLNDAECWYTLDDADLTGSNPDDVSGATTHDGTSANVTTGATGNLGEAFTLNGSTSYVSSNTTLTQQVMTFVIGFKTTSTSQSGLWSGDGVNKIQMLINAAATNRVRVFQKVSDVTKINSYFNLTTPTDGNWQQVVMVLDLDTPDCILYQNGSEVTPLSEANVAATANAWTYDIALGANEKGTSRNLFLNGTVDNVGFYTRELTSGEVTTLYNSGTWVNPYAPTGYGNDIIGVASANIGKVNGVATANISKVNGS